MNQLWITFDNRIVSLNEMSHGHMSNIYHYINHIMPEIYTQKVKDDISYWLNKRFKGVVLDYIPHKDFHLEHDYLKTKFYFQCDNSIVVNGEKIGQLCTN